MERTIEELERLLVGREVSVRYKEGQDTEQKAFTVRRVSTFHTIMALYGGEGEGESTFVRTADLDKFMRGKPCMSNTGPMAITVTLLPVEGEEPTGEPASGKRTRADLEKLLEEKVLVGRTLREEPGKDCVIAESRYSPLSSTVELKFKTGYCAFTLPDVERLLGGCKVEAGGRMWSLLPGEGPAKGEDLIPTSLKGVESGSVEEWIRKNYGGRPFNELARNIAEKDLMDAFKADCGPEPTEEEPATEPEQPTEPKLSRAWTARWWQAYWHFFQNEEALHNAAGLADDVVAYAMKHLEG